MSLMQQACLSCVDNRMTLRDGMFSNCQRNFQSNYSIIGPHKCLISLRQCTGDLVVPISCFSRPSRPVHLKYTQLMLTFKKVALNAISVFSNSEFCHHQPLSATEEHVFPDYGKLAGLHLLSTLAARL